MNARWRHLRLSGWYFFYFAFVGAYASYFTLFLQSLNFSAVQISVLMSISQVMRLAAPPLWGMLADRYGHRLLIVRLAAAASAFGFALAFFRQDFAGLFVAKALMMFFWSAALPLVEALTLEHLRGRTGDYGRIRLWGSIGFIVTTLLAGWLLDRWPLSAVLWICLGLLIGILLSALALPEAPTAAHEEGTAQRHQPLIWRQNGAWALFAASFLMSVAHGPLYVFYSIHLADHGYERSTIGLYWSLGVIAEILVFLIMPLLMRRFTLRTILAFSLAIAVLRFTLIGWGATSTTLLLLAQLMHGATFGAFHAAAVAWLHHAFPIHQQARAQAIYGSISFGAGGLVGGLLAGQTWHPLGAGWTYSAAALFAAGGLLLMLRATPASHDQGEKS